MLFRSEENAATAKTLEQQSAAMNERVGAFKLTDAPVVAFKRPAPDVARERPMAPAKRQPAPARRAPPAARGQASAAVAVQEGPGWQEF